MEFLTTLPFWALLLIFVPVCFIQNMAFTAVSRSRNSGDVQHHRRCSWASNAVWFITQVLILTTVWPIITEGKDLWKILLVGIVYVLATTEGSAYQMAKMLRTETGKRRVGANETPTLTASGKLQTAVAPTPVARAVPPPTPTERAYLYLSTRRGATTQQISVFLDVPTDDTRALLTTLERAGKIKRDLDRSTPNSICWVAVTKA